MPTPIAWTRTPAVDATSASSSGSGPRRVLAVGEQHDRGRAEEADVHGAGVAVERRLRRSSAACPRSRSSDVKRPWPSDVPPLDREPVDRRDHVSLTLLGLQHGDGAVAERDDADPDRAAAGRSTKARAAAFAASIRVGSRSLARMLFETSKARITVPCRSGSARLTVGRASAKQTSAIAAAKSANGMWRRQRRSPRRRRRDEPFGREPGGALGRARERHRVREDQQRARTRGRSSIHGEPSDISAPPLARLDDADERADEVVRRSTPRRCRRRRGASARAARPRAARRPREAAAELGVARVDDELLAGLGVLDDDHAGVGQLELARVEQADRDDLVALASAGAAAAPSRAR